MPKYRLNYGDQFEFFAQTPAEVVPVMQTRRYGPLSFGVTRKRFLIVLKMTLDVL